MKKCPYCSEEIQDEAIKCKHCGEILLAIEKHSKSKIPIIIITAVMLAVTWFIYNTYYPGLMAPTQDIKTELTAWVRDSIQKHIETDNAYKGLTIGEIALVRESSNKFTGYVEYKYRNETEKADLVVTMDGNERLYRCEPPNTLIMKKNFSKP